MEKVVIDTNVLVSSLLSTGSKPHIIMSLVSRKELLLFYSRFMLNEYKRVLAYKKLNIAPDLQEEAIKKILELGSIIDPPISNVSLGHEDDRIFYDAAKFTKSILITGNIKHYPIDSKIMTPANFLLSFDE